MQSVSGERILFGLAGFGLGALQGIISSLPLSRSLFYTSSVFQPFSSIFLVDFIGRYMTWMEEKERQLDEGDILL